MALILPPLCFLYYYTLMLTMNISIKYIVRTYIGLFVLRFLIYNKGKLYISLGLMFFLFLGLDYVSQYINPCTGAYGPI